MEKAFRFREAAGESEPGHDLVKKHDYIRYPAGSACWRIHNPSVQRLSSTNTAVCRCSPWSTSCNLSWKPSDFNSKVPEKYLTYPNEVSTKRYNIAATEVAGIHQHSFSAKVLPTFKSPQVSKMSCNTSSTEPGPHLAILAEQLL